MSKSYLYTILWLVIAITLEIVGLVINEIRHQMEHGGDYRCVNSFSRGVHVVALCFTVLALAVLACSD